MEPLCCADCVLMLMRDDRFAKTMVISNWHVTRHTDSVDPRKLMADFFSVTEAVLKKRMVTLL